MINRTHIKACLASIYILVYSQAFADQPPPQFIQFSPSATMGALYMPDPDKFPKPHIATLAMHRDSNQMSHISTKEMPKRGIVALGMNPRCQNNESLCEPWENNALDVKQGIEYLRKLPGIDTIILFGHSGGGPTMAFYQAVAESGIAICQKPEKLTKCADSLANLPKADGVILMDSHPGNGVNAVRSLNPAVINDQEIIESNALPKIDPALDPYNPANGYNPKGESHYSDAFREKYFKGQSARMNRLIDIAEGKLKQIEAGTYRYPDGDAFIVPRGDNSRLYILELDIENSSHQPVKLIKNDGSVADCCTVTSVRPVINDPEANADFRGGALFLTLKSFLSVRAIRSTDSLHGIDWCSSNNSAPCSLRNVSVPLLIAAMGGHYFIRDSEIIFENAASKDKDLIVVEGATHGGTPCKECMPGGQAYDGRYDNAVKNGFDYMAKWINARFDKKSR